MKNKIKQILEEDIKPFNLVSKNNNNYIIKALLKDKISSLDAQITIDFDFIFDKIHFILVENGQEIHQQIVFQELKNNLIYVWKTSELTKVKLMMFINDIILKIYQNLHTNIKCFGLRCDISEYFELRDESENTEIKISGEKI